MAPVAPDDPVAPVVLGALQLDFDAPQPDLAPVGPDGPVAPADLAALLGHVPVAQPDFDALQPDLAPLAPDDPVTPADLTALLGQVPVALAEPQPDFDALQPDEAAPALDPVAPFEPAAPVVLGAAFFATVAAAQQLVDFALAAFVVLDLTETATLSPSVLSAFVTSAGPHPSEPQPA